MAKRAEGTTEKLLASARREFSRHGFANASLRTIALDSGVTTHTVYTRFDSKEGLFAALVGPAAGKFMETLMAGYDRYFDMGNESIRERELFSHSVYEELVDLMFDNRDAFMLLLDASAGTAFEHYVEKVAEQPCRRIYAQSDVLGMPLDDDQRLLVHVLTRGFFDGVFETLRHGLDRRSAQAFVSELISFYEGGLAKASLGQAAGFGGLVKELG